MSRTLLLAGLGWTVAAAATVTNPPPSALTLPLLPADNRRLDENSDNPSERDAYELVAFLLWYIFLVLCCVVPTCCAYRRRRIVEQRMNQQQADLARMQESNFFFLSSLTTRRDGEAVQAERSRVLTDALKDTTMTVKESDMETLPHSERPSVVSGEIVAINKVPDDPHSLGIEYDVEEPDHQQVLVLPENATNGNRKVPGVCAICLCAYEAGDIVTWSVEDSCQHAFHKDCLVPWLAKKNEPHCPVCRQAFCKVTYNENESMYDTPFNFSQSFSQALARARLEASIMSRIESGGLPMDGLEFVTVTPAGTYPSLRVQTSNVTSTDNNSSNGAIPVNGAAAAQPAETPGAPAEISDSAADASEDSPRADAAPNSSANPSSTATPDQECS